jgi:hypothetical protein
MERSSILIGVSYLKRGPFIGGGSLEGPVVDQFE